ncbi:ABC transporter substrate-binding protein [Lactonifactor longoviformis]|uniref:ABC transporter substrate-binding protein n=1 Tax=Lactonifactor longoviformis TaxID=341220 RepID=UPI0021090F76|nr:ABC transporter substrate-binding protein [Lactonifactor longoviformis]MCQ4672278.1 ABC transporter substrate-binding protein [Lactonifactor longoviformis]
MKKRRKAILALICTAALLAGCSGSGDSGTKAAKDQQKETQSSEKENTDGREEGTKGGGKTEITVGFSNDTDSWDPCSGFGYAGSPLFSTLVKVNGKNQLENDLATEYSMSGDGLTWTFKIRGDVKFTNGEKLDASDVAFTFNTTKDKATYVDLTMLESCRAVDESTVEFKLNKPCVTFIYTVAGAGIVPEDTYSDSFGMEPIGSGPYKLTQWDKGQQFILEANEDYYGEQPKIKKAVFLVQEEDARFVAAQAGEVDLALTSATLAATEIEGMKVVSVESVDNRGITFPMLPEEGKTTEDGYKIGNNVTSDLAIRKAMSYGIDREQIIDEALNGFAEPAYSECDGLPWWNEEDVIETDIDYAVQQLEAAGWKDTDGDGIREKGDLKAEFNLMYFAGDSMRQAVAMSVANQAKEKLGIAIHVEGVSADDTVKRMFSEPMIMGWGSDSPMTSYMLFHSSNAGKTDFYNPEFFTSEVVDGYLDKAMNSKTMEESLEWWKKAQWDGTTGTSMRGEAPWAFYVNMSHLYYVKEGLDIGEQRIHAHGAAWPLIANLAEWEWKE